MSLPIVTAEERLAGSGGIKGQIWGKYGVGKTSLLWTLDPTDTLAIDLEAGMLAVQGWQGDSMKCRTWQELVNFVCFLGGPDPSRLPEQAYSEAHYRHVAERFGDPAVLAKYRTIFFDSITVASRLCLQWARSQPEAISERTGKPDMRGAYGVLGRELPAMVNHLQQIPDRNVWIVGGIEETTDDFNRRYWRPLIDGSKAASALPYIVDQVITMAELLTPDGVPYRALICGPNTWGYPTKDRSARLDPIEEPHLGKLMAKIRGPLRPAAERLTHTIPTTTETEST